MMRSSNRSSLLFVLLLAVVAAQALLAVANAISPPLTIQPNNNSNNSSSTNLTTIISYRVAINGTPVIFAPAAAVDLHQPHHQLQQQQPATSRYSNSSQPPLNDSLILLETRSVDDSNSEPAAPKLPRSSSEKNKCNNTTHFACASGNACVPLNFRCDGQADCSDGSDEFQELCKKFLLAQKCASNEYKCKSGKCIPLEGKCDGLNDCPHGDDEKNCAKSSSQNHQCDPFYEFRCPADGTCIELRHVCDTHRDCSDGADEKNCSSKRKSNATTTTLFDTSNSAFDDEGDGETLVQRTTKQQLKSAKRRGSGQATKKAASSSVERSRAGGSTKSKPKSDAELFSVFEHQHEEDDERHACAREKFRCHSGDIRCIPRVQQCNNEADCDDGSDEFGCSCMPHEFTCADNDHQQCVPIFARCNGTVECRDSSDEQKCEDVYSPDKCSDSRTEFNCGDGFCIPRSQLCDFKFDCPNQRDESREECLENCRNTCHHQCVDGPHPYCACQMGYRLKDDGVTCLDVDECKVPGACSQQCINTEGSYRCKCDEGFMLEVSPDAYNNVVEQSQNLTINDAWFLRNQYSFAVNNFSTTQQQQRHVSRTFCKALHGRPDYLVVRDHEILLYNASTHQVRAVQSDQDAPFSVDFHHRDGMLVWSDLHHNAVYRAPLNVALALAAAAADGGNNTDLLQYRVEIAKTTVVDSVAVDWLHQHVYFSDNSFKTIEVVYLYPLREMENSEYTKVTVISGGLSAPRAIQLDPEEGWMYWSDWGGQDDRKKRSSGSMHTIITEAGSVARRTGKIERAGMDGSRREQIWPPTRFLDATGEHLLPDTPVEYYLYWVNGLSLDRINKRLYFVDAMNRDANGGGHLASVRVDGSDYRFIMSSASALKYTVGLTLWEDDVVWADYYGDGAAACNKFRGDNLRHVFGGQNRSFDNIRAESHAELAAKKRKSRAHLYDIKAVHAVLQQPATLPGSACAMGAHKCSHMCLPFPREEHSMISSFLARLIGLGGVSGGVAGSSGDDNGSSLPWRCVCPRGKKLALDHKTCVDKARATAAAEEEAADADEANNNNTATAAVLQEEQQLTEQVVAMAAANGKGLILYNINSNSNGSSIGGGEEQKSPVATLHGESSSSSASGSSYFLWLLAAIVSALLVIVCALFIACREPNNSGGIGYASVTPLRRATRRSHRIRALQQQLASRFNGFGSGSTTSSSKSTSASSSVSPTSAAGAGGGGKQRHQQFKHHRLHSASVTSATTILGGDGGAEKDAAAVVAGLAMIHHNNASAATVGDEPDGCSRGSSSLRTTNGCEDDDIVFHDIDLLDEPSPYARPLSASAMHHRNSLMPTSTSPEALATKEKLEKQQQQQQQRKGFGAARIVMNGGGSLLSHVRRISYSKRSKNLLKLEQRNEMQKQQQQLLPPLTTTSVGCETLTATKPAAPVTYQLDFTPPGSLPLDSGDVLCCASSSTSVSSSSFVVEDSLPLVPNQA